MTVSKVCSLYYEIFTELQNPEAFQQVENGGYFIEWKCGADLSADTLEAHWEIIKKVGNETTAPAAF